MDIEPQFPYLLNRFDEVNSRTSHLGLSKNQVSWYMFRPVSGTEEAIYIKGGYCASDQLLFIPLRMKALEEKSPVCLVAIFLCLAWGLKHSRPRVISFE